MSKYYVAKNGEQSGPFSLEEIVNQLGSATISLTDYIYNDTTNDWILLMAHKELNQLLLNKKPNLPPPAISVSPIQKSGDELIKASSDINLEIPPANNQQLEVDKIQPPALGDVNKVTNQLVADSDSDTAELDIQELEENTTEIDLLQLNENKIEKKSLVEAFDNVSNCVYQEKINEIKNGKGSVREKALKISRALEEVADPIMSEWYILKDNNKYGPYTYKDMLNMLDEKFIYGFDFVWHKSLSNWRRLADLDAFTYQNINKLKNTYMPELTQLYYKRRHKRVNYGHSIMVHDNNRVWKAKSVQIGQGGVGVLMEETHVVKGATLYLHFQPGDGVPPFNAVCEVVSKKLQENKETRRTEILYGMKFLKISNDISSLVNDISKSKKVG